MIKGVGKPIISGVYKITNLINSSFYIGSSNNIYRRWGEHRSHLKYNKHGDIYLQRAYNKYSLNNFNFEIIAICPFEYCLKLEQWFIDNLKPDYNLAKNTTQVRLNLLHTQESKQKTHENIPKKYSDEFLDIFNSLKEEGLSQVQITNKLHLPKSTTNYIFNSRGRHGNDM